MFARRVLLALLVVVLVLPAGCGAGSHTAAADAGAASDSGSDAALPEDDAGRDAGCYWDMDGDGHRAPECGGDDCDDTDPYVHPGAIEDVARDVVATADSAEVDLALAIDASGAVTPHLCFVDGGTIHARAGSGGWRFERVDDGAEVCAVAIDDDGRPHLAYDIDGVVFHASRGSTGWDVRRVGRGVAPDLSIDAGGVSHVVYVACELADRCSILYASGEEDTFAPVVIAEVRVQPRFDGRDAVAVAIDASDGLRVALASTNEVGRDLRYARLRDGRWQVFEAFTGAPYPGPVTVPDTVALTGYGGSIHMLASECPISGSNPSPLGEALRGLAVRSRHDGGIPEGLPHGLSAALPLRVHPEVPQAGAAWRGGAAVPGADPGGVPVAGCGDREGSHPAGPCSPAAERAAEFGAEPRDAADQGEIVSSAAARVSPYTKGILGTASLGARFFRGEQRERQ